LVSLGPAITTAHNQGARNLRVKPHDGRVFAARVERIGGEDIDLALALTDASLEPAVLGSVRDLTAGDEVWTIGCPLGFEFSATRGVVTVAARQRAGLSDDPDRRR
jgi:S1-C subfamily serine protease